MAEKVLENFVCENCGVDIRPQSMFCYNCGGAVSETPVEESSGSISDAWLKDDFTNKSKSSRKSKKSLKAERKATLDKITENNEAETESEVVSEVEEPKIETVEKEAELKRAEEQLITEKSARQSDIQKEAKLKSAAAMRRKAKSFQAKQVEVVWEEPENSSSVKLVLVVFLLTLFAVGVVVLANYLK